jgi:6-phosphogluconolactonase/glucosamine-6-phosphate isomerase/deaminase
VAFIIYITRDFAHMSKVAADIVEADIREKQSLKDEYVLGLTTGNTMW